MLSLKNPTVDHEKFRGMYTTVLHISILSKVHYSTETKTTESITGYYKHDMYFCH